MVKNAGWLITGRIVQMLLSLIVGILSARYLGPSNYGVINYAGAYTTFFTSLCHLGINAVIVKEFIDHPKDEGQVIGTTLGLRAFSSILSAITIIAIACIVDRGERITQLVVTLYSMGLIFNIFETFNYWYHSRLQSKKIVLASTTAYMVTAVYKIILLMTGKPVAYFALATSVDYICIAIIMLIFYKKDHGGKLIFSWKYGKELLAKSYHYILPGVMTAIYGQTDKIMLKHMIGDSATGHYSTAVAVSTMWCFVLTAIIDSMNPSIMEAYKVDKEKFRQRNKILYSIVFWLSTTVAIAFTLFGEFFIGVLYGEAYLPAAALLKIVTWYTSLSYLGVARNAWIVCNNKQKYLKYLYIPAAISNVVLNLILIPPLGSAGAAVASLIAEVITTIVVPFVIKDLRENSILMLESIVLKDITKRK